ncbi:DUF4871 domain-containing protein [Metabacillus halosaccharovorans]|uniref:DUF4871 domain-containing protein n=1 Tax=Metabacillus halosaccharovorans TaxID=930124 RepID=UPI001C1F7A1D|nr:DUF4871 domain-containing protein [Metabacillus halosaccharovorans]MBU7592851.1 hypothetical protein [Metabacillus halosaccharovorans]
MKLISFIFICAILLTGCSSKETNDVAQAKESTTKEQPQEKIETKSNISTHYNDSDLTPTFTLNEKINEVIMVYKIRGEENNFGLLDKPLIKDEEINLDWLFWSLDNQEPIGKLKINGLNLETKESVIAEGQIVEKKRPIKDLPTEYPSIPLNNNKTTIEEEKISEENPKSMATTTILFPQSGIWELEVSLNEKSLGSIRVFVGTKESNIYYLND